VGRGRRAGGGSREARGRRAEGSAWAVGRGRSMTRQRRGVEARRGSENFGSVTPSSARNENFAKSSAGSVYIKQGFPGASDPPPTPINIFSGVVTPPIRHYKLFLRAGGGSPCNIPC
jgi:hypothetical protein